MPFFETETDERRGMIDSDTLLDDVKSSLRTKEQNFDNLIIHVEGINNRAREYVDLVPLYDENVSEDFYQIGKKITSIDDAMRSADYSAQQVVNELSAKVDRLRSDLQMFLTEYSDGTRITFEEIGALSSKEWFNPAKKNVLTELWMNDPFIYVSGHGAVWETQWISGNMDTFFVYVGESFFRGYGHFHLEGGNISAAVGAEVLSITGGMIVGDGIAHVSGGVSLLSANAHIVSEFDDLNNFDFGFGASASAISGTIGIEVFEVPTTNGGVTNLIGANVSGGKGSAGIGFGYSSVNVTSAGPFYVNVVTIDLAAALGLEIGLEVTAPTVVINPFQWISSLSD